MTGITLNTGACQRWSRWRLSALERLPLPYGITVAFLTAAAAAGQIIEYVLSERFRGLAPEFRIGDALVMVGFVIYVLLYLWVLKQESPAELLALRPSVLVSDEQYDVHVRRMLQADWRIELGLLSLSVAMAFGLYAAPIRRLVEALRGLWAWPLLVVFLGCVYLSLIWLLLVLVYTGVRYGRALRSLTRCPLALNAFDNSHLLPFGRLSLLASLWLVGIVLIPLVTLGPPTSGGYVVIGLSAISLLVLFVPLWGVHRQMAQARSIVLCTIQEQFLHLQEALLQQKGPEAESLKALAERASHLGSLHKMVSDAPTWPFARGGGTLRAVLAAASPLIYFLLTQLISSYLFPQLPK